MNGNCTLDIKTDLLEMKHDRLSFGFQLIAEYNQTAKGTDFMGIGFNAHGDR